MARFVSALLLIFSMASARAFGAVYIAGVDGNTNACCWSGTNEVVLPGGLGGQANSIFVAPDSEK